MIYFVDKNVDLQLVQSLISDYQNKQISARFKVLSASRKILEHFA